jgi:hypothetical protein
MLVAALLIVILVAGGEEGSGVRSPRGVDVDADEPRPPLAPPTVEASARPFTVMLQWGAPEGDADRLVVYRDGDRLAPIEPSRTRFVDDSVLPAVRYTYVIEAVVGGKASKSDAIRVKTPPAPLGMARLDGTFTVDLRDTSHYGFSSFPGDIQSGWRFKPKCRRGGCDVTWKDAQGVALAGVLKNTGARYEGTATTRLASCGDLRGIGNRHGEDRGRQGRVGSRRVARDEDRRHVRRTLPGTARMRGLGSRLPGHGHADRLTSVSRGDVPRVRSERPFMVLQATSRSADGPGTCPNMRNVPHERRR